MKEMNTLNWKHAIAICLVVILLTQCGTRKRTKVQESNVETSFTEIAEDHPDTVETEPLMPLVALCDSIRLILPKAGGMKGNYSGRTFSHKGTNYRYTFFGKTEPWDVDKEDDMAPSPPIPGLAKGWVSVYCKRDTCFTNRVVLALRCPDVDTLKSWMSERVKTDLEENLANDMDVDAPAITIPACPRPDSVNEICSYYLSSYSRAFMGLFDTTRCPDPAPRGMEYRQPARQAGLMLFDCWRSGDLYTFYEATWYDWLSCGDNTRESYRTIDTRTGEELSLEDFVDEKDYGRFAKILMKYLTKAAGNRTEALEDYAADGSDILPLIDGCGLVKEGLVVYFYPYTLSAGSFGQFNAVIPSTALLGILKQR